MIRRPIGIVLLLTALVRPCVGQPLSDVLDIVPREMAACVIVQDAAAHYQRFLRSPAHDRLSSAPVIKEWKESPEFARLESAQALIPVYFGMSASEFGSKLLGHAIVLAFRPGERPGIDDVGIVACRASDEKVLATVVDALTSQAQGRTVQVKTHRGHRYYFREEPGRPADYLVSLGLVVALTGSEEVARLAIDAKLDGGISRDPLFQTMLARVDRDCPLALLLNPRPFDRHVANAAQRYWGGAYLADFWRSLRWTSVVVSTKDHTEIRWHVSMDNATLPPLANRWGKLLDRGTDFWGKVPDDAVAAGHLEVDVPALATFLARRLAWDRDPSKMLFSRTVSALLAGYDIQEDVFPRLGPDLSFILTAPRASEPSTATLASPPNPREPTSKTTNSASSSNGANGGNSPSTAKNVAKPAESVAAPFHWVGMMSFTESPTPPKRGSLTLTQAVETASRPLLVFLGMEYDASRADRWTCDTLVDGDTRIHYLQGVKPFPDWLRPAFAVRQGTLYVGVSPESIQRACSTPSRSLEQSEFGKRLRKDRPASYRLKLYVNSSKARELVERHQDSLIAFFSRRRPELEPAIKKRLSLALAVADTVDRATLGCQSDAEVRTWILSLYPTPDAGASARATRTTLTVD